MNSDNEITLNLLIICFWMSDCILIDELNYEYIIQQKTFLSFKDCFPEEYYTKGVETTRITK